MVFVIIQINKKGNINRSDNAVLLFQTLAPAQHGNEQRIIDHQTGQTLKNQSQARSLGATRRTQNNALTRICRRIARRIESPIFGQRHALILRELKFATRCHTRRHIEADRIALICRNRNGYRTIVYARRLRAKRSHIGRTANNGNPGKALLRRHQRIIRHRALMRNIAEQHPADPHIFGLLNGFFHRRHGRHRPKRAVTRDMGNRWRFFDHADIGPRIHRTRFDIVQIRDQAQNPVRINPAQIRPNKHFCFYRGIFRWHARVFKNGLDKRFEVFCANANVRHGNPFLCQPLPPIPRGWGLGAGRLGGRLTSYL